MAKFILTVLAVLVFLGGAKAQYCGNSDSALCSPQQYAMPGLFPEPDSLMPFVDGVGDTRTLGFKAFDTIILSGQLTAIDSMTISHISDIPSGSCWATNKRTNTFAKNESGCIKITGLTWAQPGQYKLDIVFKVYAHTGGSITLNADSIGLYYYMRVNCLSCDRNQPIDTTQTAADSIILYTSAPYNLTCEDDPCTAVTQIEANIQSLNVFPNPIDGAGAKVDFNSSTQGTVTEKITTIIGATVYSNNIEVKEGYNAHTIYKNGLAAGVYFYTITDGLNSITRKIVVE